MHELYLVRALLKQVEPIARQHDAPVSRAVLCVGSLSDAGPELQDSSIRARCLACGAETTATINRLDRARCGAIRTRLLSGDALDLMRVELQPTEVKDHHE